MVVKTTEEYMQSMGHMRFAHALILVLFRGLKTDGLAGKRMSKLQAVKMAETVATKQRKGIIPTFPYT